MTPQNKEVLQDIAAIYGQNALSESDKLLLDSQRIEQMLSASEKYASAMNDDGKRRAMKAFQCILQGASARANILMSAESSGRFCPSERVRRKLLLTKQQMMDKAFPHLSITSLYRRYRQVYLLALEDVIVILLDSTSLEEAHAKIVEKVKELGQTHKDEIRDHRSELLKTNVKVEV